MAAAEPARAPFDREAVARGNRIDAGARHLGDLGPHSVAGQVRDDVRPGLPVGYLALRYIAGHHSSISFAAELSQLIILRSGLPVCSI